MKIIIKISETYILKKCFLYLFLIIALTGQAIEAESSSLLINLDPDNKSGASPGYTAVFTEGNLPVNITSSDAFISDSEDTGINYLTITITNPKPGDILKADDMGTDIIFQYNQNSLTLTGMSPGGLNTAAQYEQVLKTVQFNNPGKNPDTSLRTIEFTAFSGETPGNTVKCLLTVVSVNSAPVNTVPDSQMTPKNVPLVFSSSNGNRISVSDEEAEAGEIKVSLDIDTGIFILAQDSGSRITGNNTKNIVITGTVEQVNSDLDGLKYEPKKDWFGKVYLNIETSDLGYSGIPGPLTDTDIVEITVGVTTELNQPPIAIAGGDLIVEEYQAVSLNGSGSSDPDGEITDYKWIQTEGVQVVLSGAETAFASFTSPGFEKDSEILSFQITVTDNKGKQGVDTVIVKLVQTAEPDAVFNEGQTVILDTSDSIDDMKTYKWTQISGPVVFLSDSAAASPSFVAPIVSSQGARLIFELNSENQEGAKFTTRVIIQVNDNGIIGFPEDVLTFSPTTATAMGIKIIEGELLSIKGITPDETSSENRPENLIYGLINMQIRVLTSAGRAVAEIYFSEPVDSELKWFGYNEVLGWSEYGENSVFSEDRRYVTLYLNDSGPNDNDGLENGIVNNSSCPGKPVSGTEGGDGDSGGGCFIIVLDPVNHFNPF